MTAKSPLLLDTHVWFRYQALPHLLRPGLVDFIDGEAQRRGIFASVISIWELAMLERDHRIETVGGIAQWSQQALAKPGIQLLPYTAAIAIESVFLPPPMHKDPGDRVLVASARVERLTLVTRDKLILQFARLTGLACLRA